MYIGMIETRSLKILLKSFHENYSNLFKKTTRYLLQCCRSWNHFAMNVRRKSILELVLMGSCIFG